MSSGFMAGLLRRRAIGLDLELDKGVGGRCRTRRGLALTRWKGGVTCQ